VILSIAEKEESVRGNLPPITLGSTAHTRRALFVRFSALPYAKR